MVKLGIIAFANYGGLAVQTRRLASFLHPYRVMVIDSTPFSKNKKHNFDWYKDYDNFIIKGFPKNYDVLKFLDGLTHVFVCENPYNFYLIKVCKERGIKVFVQSNYEFCENLNAPHLPLPDKFLMPSYWMIDDMRKRFGNDRVQYLPPPIDSKEFGNVFSKNLQRKGKKRFLHIVGTLASKDRNGTLDLLRALKYSKEDYELVITSQHPFPSDEYFFTDRRVQVRVGNEENNCDLYRDADVLVLPRRYGGLSLTTNEALLCGMPVIMPKISPNKELLPSTWLVKAEKKDVIHARTDIDVYEVSPRVLAHKIDEFARIDLSIVKTIAYSIGVSHFSWDILKREYDKLWI